MSDNDIHIISVNSRKLRRQFRSFPKKLYKNDPKRVAPLAFYEKRFFHPKKNTYFTTNSVQFFLAIRFGKVVGRISAHENTVHNTTYRDKTGFIGFFECINSQRVANTLFNAARDWLASRGFMQISGPLNFTINDTSALLTKGFSLAPAVMMPYNPPYYQELWENYGFKKENTLYAWQFDETSRLHPIVRKISRVTQMMPGLIVRRAKKKDFINEIQKAFDLYARAWQADWGNYPPSYEEFMQTAKWLKWFGNPDYAWIAEINDTPVGMGLAIPNINEILIKLKGRLFPFGLIKLFFNRKKCNSIRVLVLELDKQFEDSGIDALLYEKIYDQAVEDRLDWGEVSWVTAGNKKVNKVMEKSGGKVLKEYTLYRSVID